MGNKCCRSDGHVSLDSISNDKLAVLVEGQGKSDPSDERLRGSSEAASTCSDVEAVQSWRERGLDHREQPNSTTTHQVFPRESYLPDTHKLQSSPSSDSQAIQDDIFGQKPPQSRDFPPGVDSDVESITKDQYLTACQLLHETIVRRQDRLTETEREFLEGLMHGFDEEFSLDHLTVIESATKALASDPLFLESPIKMDSSRRRILVVGEGDDDMIPDDLKARNQSFSSVEILRELEEDEGNMLLSMPNQGTVQFDSTFRESEGVELSLQLNNSVNSDGSIVRSDCNGTDEGGSTVPNIDLGPSIARLRSAQEALGDYKHGNSITLLKPDGPPGPYQHTSSTSNTEPNLIEEVDDDGTPYNILGAHTSSRRILTPALMEALRGFLPFVVSEENFWLKFTLEYDGDSLINLLHTIRGSKYTFLAIRSGNKIFGSFTGSKWRKQAGWFGSGEAFLWRLMDSLKVYPYTGSDTHVQYCTGQMIAVGGGAWGSVNSPYSKTTQSQGIGLLIDADLRGGESNSCATFCNPTLSGDVQEFNIDDLEVWTLTPCNNVSEADNLELHKLFAEEHRKK